MLVNEISMASFVVSIDSAWIERKRPLISLMKNKSVYQIQVKSRSDCLVCCMVHTTLLYGAYSIALWCIALHGMHHRGYYTLFRPWRLTVTMIFIDRYKPFYLF